MKLISSQVFWPNSVAHMPALGVPGEALRVAVAVAPREGAREWVVGGHGAVEVEPQDLAVRASAGPARVPSCSRPRWSRRACRRARARAARRCGCPRGRCRSGSPPRRRASRCRHPRPGGTARSGCRWTSTCCTRRATASRRPRWRAARAAPPRRSVVHSPLGRRPAACHRLAARGSSPCPASLISVEPLSSRAIDHGGVQPAHDRDRVAHGLQRRLRDRRRRGDAVGVGRALVATGAGWVHPPSSSAARTRQEQFSSSSTHPRSSRWRPHLEDAPGRGRGGR